MPCSYRVYPDRNLVVKNYEGRVTTKCVLDLIDRMESDPAYQPGMLEFDDLSRVSELAIPPADIKRFAELMTGLGYRRRRCTRKAVFVSTDDARHATEQFMKEVEGSSTVEVGVFCDARSALDFLGVPETAVAGLALLQQAP